MRAEHFVKHFKEISAELSFSDVLQNSHNDTATINDLPGWWASIVASKKSLDTPPLVGIEHSLAELSRAAIPVLKNWRNKPVHVTTPEIEERRFERHLDLSAKEREQDRHIAEPGERRGES